MGLWMPVGVFAKVKILLYRQNRGKIKQMPAPWVVWSLESVVCRLEAGIPELRIFYPENSIWKPNPDPPPKAHSPPPTA